MPSDDDAGLISAEEAIVARLGCDVSLMCWAFPRRSASAMRDDSPCEVDSVPPERRLLFLSNTSARKLHRRAGCSGA